MAPQIKINREVVDKNKAKASLASIQNQTTKPNAEATKVPTLVIKRPTVIRKAIAKPKAERKVAAAVGVDKIQTPGTSASSSSVSQIFNRDFRSFSKKYLVESQIGNGGYGTVHAAVRKSDKLMVAIKQIRLTAISEWSVDQETGLRIPTEVFLLHKCSSVKGVIKIIEYFQSKTHALIVMERIPGFADLFDYISSDGCLLLSSARYLVQQITQTLAQCHALGVVHRDLKQENVLYNEKTGEIKLLDFGLGTCIENSNQKFDVFKGTGVYKPPEYFKNKVTFADSMTVWSIGCFAYSVIFGDVPFQNDVEIMAGIFRMSLLNKLPKDCQDFILQTLKRDPESRPLLQDLVNHPWIAENKPSPPPRGQGKKRRSNSYEVIEIGERPSTSDSSSASSSSSNNVEPVEESRDPRIYLKLRRMQK